MDQAMVKEGVRNLVGNCAEVRKGENVLILNGFGAVDDEVATLLEETVSEAGAECHVLWGEPQERRASSIPKVVVGAILAADKFICNYTLNRVVLEEHLKGTGVVQVDNRFRTGELMGSEAARFPTGMIRALCQRLDELFAGARRWRITSPAGTDVSGEIARGTEIADAFFTQDTTGSRLRRVFPGEVYTPVGSVGAEGTIVVDHINLQGAELWDEPAVLAIRDDRIVAVEGGDHAQELQAEIERNVERFGEGARVLDSWHGGMHPKAPGPEPGSGALQWTTMSSSPALMHFHLGRLKDPISAGVSRQTVEVDGKRVIEDGRLAILDDPQVRAAARLPLRGTPAP